MSLLKNLLVIPFLILLSAGILTACDRQPARRTITLQGETMGTTYTVKYLSDGLKGLPSPEKVKSQLDLLLEEVNRQMSTYREDSEISRFNKMRETGKPMPIAADFAAVTAEAVRLNKATHGALDVTVGPLVNLWGFGPDKQLTYSPPPKKSNGRRMLWASTKFRCRTTTVPPHWPKVVPKCIWTYPPSPKVSAWTSSRFIWKAWEYAIIW